MNAIKLTEADFVKILGKSESSIEFQEFLKSIDVAPEVDSFEGDRKYYTFAALGFDVVLDEGRITGCHLFGPEGDPSLQPYSGSLQQYSGPLPHGLDFNDSRDALVKKLGSPIKSHPGRDDPRPTVRIKPWMKFGFPTHLLHVQLTPDSSRIELVTLLGLA